VLGISVGEWREVNQFLAEKYTFEHRNVGITRTYVSLHTSGKIPSQKQLRLAKEIRDDAYSKGFDYVS